MRHAEARTWLLLPSYCPLPKCSDEIRLAARARDQCPGFARGDHGRANGLFSSVRQRSHKSTMVSCPLGLRWPSESCERYLEHPRALVVVNVEMPSPRLPLSAAHQLADHFASILKRALAVG
jgi:hypothetical protein